MLGDIVKIWKDLVDRGPDSPGVVRLVRHLVQLGKAGHVPKLFLVMLDVPYNLQTLSEAELCVVLTRHNAFLAIMSWIFFVESTSMETTGSLANLKSSARTELSALRILRWVRSVFNCFLTQSLDTPCRSDAVPRDRGMTRRQKVSKFLQTSSFARRRTKINKDGNGNSNSVWLEREKTDCINYFYWSESNVLHHLLLWEMFFFERKKGTLSFFRRKVLSWESELSRWKTFFWACRWPWKGTTSLLSMLRGTRSRMPSDAELFVSVEYTSGRLKVNAWCIQWGLPKNLDKAKEMPSTRYIKPCGDRNLWDWKRGSIQTSNGRSIVVSTCFKLWRIASFLTQMAWLSRSIHLSC